MGAPFRTLLTSLSCVIPLLFMTSCKSTQNSDGDGDAEVLASGDTSSARKVFYETEQLQKIELNMPEWNELATQKPKGGRCNFSFMGEAFDTFTVPSIKVNGIEFKGVSAKKSSHCGSYSDTKPNLKIKFAKADKERAIKALGVDQLILKNSVQDQSLIRQCLGAEIFAKAGFPKQFCNFIEVFANGKKIGLYVNLEPTDKEFFARTLGSAGNLYEVAGEEFAPWAYNRYLNNLDSFKDPEDKSLSDLKAMIKAFEKDNSPDLNELKKYLDIDQFIRFWVMENIMVHWDGFASNINNSFMYFDPKNNKAIFLPRGIDQVLTDYTSSREPKLPYTQILFARHSLPQKLAENPKYWAQYQETVKKYLDTIWNEKELLARVDTLTALVSPHIPNWGQNAEPKWSHERLVRVIRDRKKDIARFLDKNPPKSESAINKAKVCSSKASDPDGDGWGWENNQSCKAPTGDAPLCKKGAASDIDGDGWGWEDGRSCRVK